MATMESLTTTQLVLIAGAGGFVLNMLALWQEGKKPKAMRPRKDFNYWVFFIFWPCAGAGLAWLYILDGSSLRPLLAFSVGLSAPATLQAMASKTGAVPAPPESEQRD